MDDQNVRPPQGASQNPRGIVLERRPGFTRSALTTIFSKKVIATVALLTFVPLMLTPAGLPLQFFMLGPFAFLGILTFKLPKLAALAGDRLSEVSHHARKQPQAPHREDFDGHGTTGPAVGTPGTPEAAGVRHNYQLETTQAQLYLRYLNEAWANPSAANVEELWRKTQFQPFDVAGSQAKALRDVIDGIHGKSGDEVRAAIDTALAPLATWAANHPEARAPQRPAPGPGRPGTPAAPGRSGPIPPARGSAGQQQFPDAAPQVGGDPGLVV